jgi:hypothetical protein
MLSLFVVAHVQWSFRGFVQARLVTSSRSQLWCDCSRTVQHGTGGLSILSPYLNNHHILTGMLSISEAYKLHGRQINVK